MADNLVRNVLDAALRLAGGADPGKRTRALEALDRATKAWAQKAPWPALRRNEIFLHPGGRSLSLPERVWVITSVVDKTTFRKVDPINDWDSQHSSLYAAKTVGAPDGYRPQGILPVCGQPATDTQLKLQTSGSEAYTVRIHGLRRDATQSGSPQELYEDRETFVMGGTTATLSEKTWVSIVGLEKDEGTEYNFAAVDPQTNKILTRIPSWQSRAKYPTIEFLPIPLAGTEFIVDYLVSPDDITSEESVLDSGVSREYLTWAVAGDVMWANGKRDDAQVAWAKSEQILNEEAAKATTLGEADFRAIPMDTYLEREDYYG